ncbi:hypothetical protein Pcinc_027767 [Petrolisthes cinctipes]|uniref:Major facilitator superfamily (MFS) profile domain-containing protein n=1 Tax=Petrolisthes cinctipes TaxID=88211 RepID=A0AAE1F494_PETCI|nr:hypothetical protein Pcinc_027767 [Petrolisthes cinctipes]
MKIKENSVASSIFGVYGLVHSGGGNKQKHLAPYSLLQDIPCWMVEREVKMDQAATQTHTITTQQQQQQQQSTEDEVQDGNTVIMGQPHQHDTTNQKTDVNGKDETKHSNVKETSSQRENNSHHTTPQQTTNHNNHPSSSTSLKRVNVDDDGGGGGGGGKTHPGGSNGNTTSPTVLQKTPNFGPFLRQGVMAVVVCLAGLSNGMVYSYPAVALARWEDAGFELSTAHTTWFASAPLIVAMLVCVCSGLVVERLGVRSVLGMGTVVLSLTWLALAYTRSFWVLLLARVVQGLVASLFMVVITVYPAEVSSVRWRGIMMGVSEAMVMLGAFLTYLGGLVLQPENLAYVFAGSLVLHLLCFTVVRETPLWLARRDRNEEAATTLAWFRGGSGEDVDREIEHIKASVFDEKVQKPGAVKQLMMLRKWEYLRPTVLCILVLLFKELTGQYAALTYTVTMFKLAGSSLDPYLCAVVMGAARFLPCLMSWIMIERLPRRYLLSSGLTISSLSFAALGGVLWYWSSEQGGLPEHLGWIPLTCISIYTLAFGCGVGPTSWTLVAELLPSKVRNVGAGILNMCFSLFLFIVGFSFPYSVEAVGAASNPHTTSSPLTPLTTTTPHPTHQYNSPPHPTHHYHSPQPTPTHSPLPQQTPLTTTTANPTHHYNSPPHPNHHYNSPPHSPLPHPTPLNPTTPHPTHHIAITNTCNKFHSPLFFINF